MVPRFGKRLKGKRRRKAAPDAEGSPSHLLSHHLCGGRWCVSTKGGAGPLGPRSGLGSEGSEGKVDGAFGPEGCIEGLCPQRGNDSLHFARRFAPSKCVRCASLRSGGDSPIGLKVVDCPLGNDYEVGVTGIPFVSTVLHEVMLKPSSSGRWESCRGLPSRANI